MQSTAGSNYTFTLIEWGLNREEAELIKSNGECNG